MVNKKLRTVDEPTNELNDVFKALADTTRRDIVLRLSRSDATVSHLASSYAISLPAVSKHLKVLERAGLIARTRIGARHWIRLRPTWSRAVNQWLDRASRERATEQLDRLEDLLERKD